VQKKSFLFLKKNSVLVLASLIVLLTYGIPVFFRWFSFYGDDWIYIYNHHLMGPASFPAFVAWDRPYSAWIYMLTTAVFGEAVLPYHILLLLERWLSVFLFWKILTRVWPSAKRMNSWAVLLFAVYPGFQQQPIAVQFILHFASLDLCLFSIWCMIRHLSLEKDSDSKTKRIFWMVVGFLSGTAAMFSCEYFVGLEAIRPFLLGFFILNCLRPTLSGKKSRFWLCLKHWLPYLASSLIFLVWRVFIFSFQTYQPTFFVKFSENRTGALLELAKKILQDLWTVSFNAWRKTINFPEEKNERLFFLCLILLVFILCWFVLSRIPEKTGEISYTKNVLANVEYQQLLTGLAVLLAAGIPFWTTWIHVENAFPWDRSTLSFIAGVALTAASLIALLFKSAPQIFITALLTSLAAGSHFSNALVYKTEAMKMNDYFWQLAWRAPGLESGTILVSDQIPLDRYSDSDLTPIINWQYAPSLTGSRYQYKYFDLQMRANTYFSNLQPGQEISHAYRSHTFQSTTDQVLAIFYRKDACLWVITKDNRDYPGLPESIFKVAGISNPDMILTDSNTTANPPDAIGKEPAHGFCYYFQKASLELQRGDLSKALNAAVQALENGLEAKDPVDWIPFAKAFVLNEKWDQANQIAEKVNGDPQKAAFFCSQLQLLEIDRTRPEFSEVLRKAGCGE
jgi:hypothetical protein